MRVVFDNNIVRSLGHGQVCVAPFVALRDEGVSIHLADGAVTELISQLLERRFRWENWLIARRELVQLLDHAEPVLLGGRQGLYRAGIRGATEEVTSADIAQAVKHSSAWWHAFMRAQHLGEITLPVRVGEHVVALSSGATAREVALFKTGWKQSFDKQHLGDELIARVQEILPRRGDGIDQINDIVRTIARTLDRKNRGGTGPRASIRLDAMIRVYVLLHLRSMRPVEPYNSERQLNDSFDHDLLRYLAYPAALCTLDRGIARKMQTAGCWQTPWVVHPNDVASPFARRLVRNMAWPTAMRSESESSSRMSRE
jgi:hypothetical protein